MTLGTSPLGTTPLGVDPIFSASFDTNATIAGPSIIEIASFVDREFIEHLKRYPNDLRNIDRRQFERLIAELFVGFGYEVELTKRTRDGGRDIIAIRKREVNSKYLIECKRPEPGNPVGVSAVRELYGVKTDDGATKAILATTTYFTSDAKQLFDRHRWELEPRDFEDIQGWIEEYLGLKSSRH